MEQSFVPELTRARTWPGNCVEFLELWEGLEQKSDGSVQSLAESLGTCHKGMMKGMRAFPCIRDKF